MTEERTPLPHPLCENIRSKKLYMISDARELAVEDLQTAGYDNCWCQHTMTDNGPDGGWVQYAHCAPGRECYEPSPHATSVGSRILG